MKRLFVKSVGFVAAAAAISVASVPANAVVIFLAGNTPGGNNVLFNNNPADGFLVDGRVNQVIDYTCYFQSNVVLHGNGGQARVEGIDGPDGGNAPDYNLTNVLVYLANPFAFTQYVFNAFTGSGTMTVTANYQDDILGPMLSSSQNFALGNGQNFTTVQASGGSFIWSVQISVTGGDFQDLRQNRISGIFNPEDGEPPADVPEPGTMAMLAGAGVVGLSLVRRRNS